MILPNKNINPSHSIIGIGTIVLKKLQDRQTISSLWDSVKRDEKISSFEKFVLAVDFLYLVGLLQLDDKGLLTKKHVD